MTGAQRLQVRELRAQNLSYRQIAARLDLRIGAIHRVLRPELVAATEQRRLAAKRAWHDANYAGRCFCGARTSNRRIRRCAPCYRTWRAQVHALALDTVQAMYEQGWPIREMSEAFGHKTAGGVDVWITELRKAGRIARRYPPRGTT